MTTLEGIRVALGLLSPSARRKFWLLVSLLSLSALLDLAGVSVLAVIALTAASGGLLPAQLHSLPVVGHAFGQLTPVSPQLIVVGLALVIILFTTKALVYTFLLRHTLRFLAKNQGKAVLEISTSLLGSREAIVLEYTSQEVAYALTQGAFYGTQVVLGGLAAIISELGVIILLLGLLLTVEPLGIAVLVVYLAGVAFVIHRWLGRWSERLGRTIAASVVSSQEAVQEAWNGRREIYASGHADRFGGRIGERLKEMTIGRSDQLLVIQLPKIVMEVAVISGASLFAFVAIARASSSSALTLLTVLLAASSRLVPSLLRILGQAIAVVGGVREAEIYFDVSRFSTRVDRRNCSSLSATTRETHSASASGTTVTFQPTLDLVCVDFRYPDQENLVLQDCSLTVHAGETITLMGSSGAGKSTIADLILGLRLPSRGQVLLGGTSAESAAQKWRDKIAFLPQRPTVLNDSVRANLLLSHETSDSEAWTILGEMGLDDVLLDSRGGLETLIGEGGVALSGGQLQRLAIARSILRHPRFLVLDEFTSALDAQSQDVVLDLLASYLPDATKVYISHREAALRVSDASYLLLDGRLTRMG